MDAIVECGGDVDKNKVFDFSGYAYDLPWRFQYRAEGITGDMDGDLKFETAIAATLFDWGGYMLRDGNTYPSNTIQSAGFLGGKMVNAINSGYIADDRNPVAAPDLRRAGGRHLFHHRRRGHGPDRHLAGTGERQPDSGLDRGGRRHGLAGGRPAAEAER